MDLGSKIRKYRTMNGMTQNELGMKIGFSSATADSRIRKYESNKMAPKEEIRQRLVEALDVDESALTDINIRSFEDVMQVLFQFEEDLGMDIEITEGKTCLTFDHSNKDIKLLLSYLFSWYMKKRSLPDPDEETQESYEANRQYEFWKASFPRSLRAFWQEQKQLLSEAYAPIKEEVLPDIKMPEEYSDLIRHYRKMIEAGIDYKADHYSFGIGDGSLVLSFPISEMIEIKDTEAGKLFAEFLCDLDFLEENGMRIYREVFTTERGTQISYILRYASLSAIASIIEEIQKYEANKDQISDWNERFFQCTYENNLEQYSIKIFG